MGSFCVKTNPFSSIKLRIAYIKEKCSKKEKDDKYYRLKKSILIHNHKMVNMLLLKF